jgi:hypothetical protein
MAIYKIFPEKSATIYSFYPTLNTGLDEILELSTYYSINGTDEVSRTLIQFPSAQVSGTIATLVSSSAFDVYLKLYLANASSIPLNYTIFCHPLSGSWNMGTGRLGNTPITTDGVSWQYKDQLGSNVWFTSASVTTQTPATGSYRSGSNSITGSVGGGYWYTGSQYASSQSFTNSTSKDIELKVTNAVSASFKNVISDYGFILKHSSSIEFTTQSKFETKYFSGNTHTIYPPCLEIRWNDFAYNTGSLSVINSDAFVISLGNNKGEFQQDSVQRFRINSRDKFPARTFVTSSLMPTTYLNNKALPTSSYWSIKDLDSEEIVVDYDLTYTKISCDASGSYFDVYMNGLQPERYYKLLFKTILSNGETIIFDENYYFKVKR